MQRCKWFSTGALFSQAEGERKSRRWVNLGSLMLIFLPSPVLRKNIGHMDLVFKLSWIFTWRKIWFKLSSFQETWDSFLCYHSYAIWLQVHSFTWPCSKDLSDLWLVYWIPLGAWALKVGIIFLISAAPDQEHKLLHISTFLNAAFFEEKLGIFKCLFHLRLNKTAFLGLSAAWNEFTGLPISRLCLLLCLHLS